MLSVKESLQLTQPKNVRMEKDILCKQKQKKRQSSYTYQTNKKLD